MSVSALRASFISVTMTCDLRFSVHGQHVVRGIADETRGAALPPQMGKGSAFPLGD
jgi:hypothetical protein